MLDEGRVCVRGRDATYESLCVSLVQLMAHAEDRKDFKMSLEHSDYICVDEPDAAHASNRVCERTAC